MLKLQVALADGQITTFNEIAASGNSATDPRILSGKLEFLLNYYPSGSKQTKGTQLDRIVETARSNSIDRIIIRLRSTTGKDIGNDPQQWLNEYPPSY
jgi:hypothetical protein